MSRRLLRLVAAGVLLDGAHALVRAGGGLIRGSQRLSAWAEKIMWGKTMTKAILCPWHDERTPSCHCDSRRDGFLCYVCGKSGTLDELAARLREVGREGEARTLRP